MGEARLLNYPNIIDRRPADCNPIIFQDSMYEYAVNSNRGLYTKKDHDIDYKQKQDKAWNKATKHMRLYMESILKENKRDG